MVESHNIVKVDPVHQAFGESATLAQKFLDGTKKIVGVEKVVAVNHSGLKTILVLVEGTNIAGETHEAVNKIRDLVFDDKEKKDMCSQQIVTSGFFESIKDDPNFKGETFTLWERKAPNQVPLPWVK
ncbi:MAG: hypothetical protein ACHQUA_02360 [Microgenomates group bacterium]